MKKILACGVILLMGLLWFALQASAAETGIPTRQSVQQLRLRTIAPPPPPQQGQLVSPNVMGMTKMQTTPVPQFVAPDVTAAFNAVAAQLGDSDGDGVPNSADRCPTTPGKRYVVTLYKNHPANVTPSQYPAQTLEGVSTDFEIVWPPYTGIDDSTAQYKFTKFMGRFWGVDPTRQLYGQYFETVELAFYNGLVGHAYMGSDRMFLSDASAREVRTSENDAFLKTSPTKIRDSSGKDLCIVSSSSQWIPVPGTILDQQYRNRLACSDLIVTVFKVDRDAQGNIVNAYINIHPMVNVDPSWLNDNVLSHKRYQEMSTVYREAWNTGIPMGCPIFAGPATYADPAIYQEIVK